MKIYMVVEFQGDYGGENKIIDIFTTSKRAEEKAKKLNDENRHEYNTHENYSVEEWEVKK